MNVNVDEVDAIFCAAIELPTAGERAEYLTNACGDNTDLRRRVDKLLAAHFAAGSFLDPRSTVLQLSPHPEMPYGPGSTIGPYKLIEQVGEGGMGVVFKAEQSRPVQRTVALKIIKPGMNTRQVIARFEAERQALAVMDHPNIARVFDAGTTDMGLPYFVMELVHGVPITRYCDEHRFAPSRRLELFIDVCQAVQHAHQKGIIHRDLKPTNVLVSEYDGRPIAKIIDFGVAKAVGEPLAEKTLLTEVGQVLGTIEYMSPEQAKLNQLDIDTRTDIYSLGVLLYELLTGTTPFDAKQLRSAAFDEMLRTIREVEPPKPSTRLSSSDALPSIAANRGLDPGKLTGLVRGDLDWIALKALDKDRDRRYETANGLADDIERYLGNEPVAACPPSRAYRFRKFARRNRTALATVAIVALALLAGIVGTTWQAIHATRQRDRAIVAEDLAQNRAGEAKRQEQIARIQELLTRKNLYSLQMNVAWEYWDAGNAGHVLELLNGLRHEPGRSDVRRFGWHYLWRLCHSERLTLRGQNKSCGCVAFSPHGDLIATCGNQDTFIELWDAATGDKRATLNEHNDGLNVLAFSPDGTLLASGSEDGILKIWDVATGHVKLSLKAHGEQVLDLAFSPDGKTLASSCIMIYLRDVTTGTVFSELRGNTGYVYGIAFSPDGQTLAAGSRDVILWNVVAGTKITTLTGHASDVGPVAYSPDGETLASGGRDSTIKLWDVQGLQEKATLRGHNGHVEDLAFSHDGKTLASAGQDGTAKLWDLASQLQLTNFKGHTDGVWSVAFSPDGRTIATASNDATVRLWDIATPPRTAVLQGHTGGVDDVAFSPEGTTLASASTDGTVKLWSVPLGQEQKTFKTHAGGKASATFSPDGKLLATCSGNDATVRLWDLATGRERSTFQSSSLPKRVRFSPNGKILGWAEYNWTVLWDLAAEKERFVLGKTHVHADDVAGEGLAFSPDAALVVTRGENNLCKLWDVATGQELATLDAGARVTCVDFAPDGRSLASASADGRIQIWDSATRRVTTSFVAHASGVRAFAYSPDQQLLATGGFDGIVKLWDLTTGLEEAILKGHTAEIHSLAFSPDGNMLASGSLDQIVRLWDLSIDPKGAQELRDARAGEATLSSQDASGPNLHP